MDIEVVMFPIDHRVLVFKGRNRISYRKPIISEMRWEINSTVRGLDEGI